MSATGEGDPGPRGLPEPPATPRRIRFRWTHLAGMLLLFGVPALSLTGVLTRPQAGADILLRVVVVYAFLFAALRLLGKREFGQLSPLEFVCLMLIPEMVQQAVVRDDDSMTTALVAISTLVLLVFLTSLVSHRSKKLESVLQGEPTLLVSRGRLLNATMDRERVTADEIFTEMRRVGLDQLDQVRWAVLEPDGHISIVAEPAGVELGRRGRLAGTESEQPA